VKLVPGEGGGAQASKVFRTRRLEELCSVAGHGVGFFKKKKA